MSIDPRGQARRWLVYTTKPVPSGRLIATVVHGIKSERLTSMVVGARTWFHALPAELQDEAAYLALRRVVQEVSLGLSEQDRTSAKHAVSEQRNAVETTKRALNKLAKRIVELLDSRQINGKSLGDCTRQELLKEAHRLDEIAGEMTLDAAFYRSLADVIGDKTVRGFEGRDKVIALLTSRWGEESA